MKIIVISQRAALLFVLCLSLGSTYAAVSGENARPLKRDEAKTVFYGNPLLLDGVSLDYKFFSMTSRGKLTVVAGDPYSPTATRIPFRLYLKRDGKIVHQNLTGPGTEKTEIDIAEVLAFAQHGDDLVIEPVRKADSGAKRIIRLRNFWFMPLLGGC